MNEDVTSSSRNIIIALCDDLGYGDLGCYGNEEIATPNIDALAESGLRCTDYYAPDATCVPSRKGLMTGVHPYRDGIRNKELLRTRTMLPAMLRNRGYSTSLIGKWHLGMEQGLHPLDQGFDYFYGTEGSNDPPLLFNLRDEVSEMTNISDENPDIVQQLLLEVSEGETDLNYEDK